MGRFKFTLKSLNCDGLWGLALLAVCAVLLLLAAGGEGVRAPARYDRIAIAGGEWYRLATAHIVHLSLEHAALNALGLAFMWGLFARDYTVAQWLGILTAATLAIDAGLWFLTPAVSWYVGASGVLHGVMAAGAVAHLRLGRADGWILAGFLGTKLAYEQFGGTALPFSSGLGPVIVDAHAYGAIGGLAASVLLPIRRASL